MSGPPHHPHNRQVPSSNPPWNHLQVPNYFPRQPQLAHRSNEHSILPTWHTPTTTETLKQPLHPHIFGLNEMLSNECFPRHAPPGVDLSVTRNGNNQNGDLPTSPISLSVRDTNKINSLPASVLQDIQAVELTKISSPIIPKSISPGLGTSVLTPHGSNDGNSNIKNQKRSNIRVDSILERLNQEKDSDKISSSSTSNSNSSSSVDKTDKHPIVNQSVIVQPTGSHDENSNSSSILNVPTPSNIREEDTVSTYSNEDSLDSNKSRRKRKPSKTVRVSKDDDKSNNSIVESNSVEDKKAIPPPQPPTEETLVVKSVAKLLEENKIPERRRSLADLESDVVPAKTRRKTSSESETIDNIAAMVQEGLREKQQIEEEEPPVEDSKSVSVSVIKTKDNLQATLISDVVTELEDVKPNNNNNNIPTTTCTPTTSNPTPNFVEVENKLEEMFAGIEDTNKPLKPENNVVEDDNFLKLDDSIPSTSQVTSTSSDVIVGKEKTTKRSSPKKKRKAASGTNSRRNSDVSSESTPKKKKGNKKSKIEPIKISPRNLNKTSSKKKMLNSQTTTKLDAIKQDVYAYDSGSNASSSKSRGPFIQIRGPRDSPISVNVVNTPTNDDDQERKVNKTKKFHDDSEYRHKVRSKGLHCSTLSNKYDAQTKDTSWICAFCKRGPHASDLTGPTSNGEIIPPGDLFGPYIITTQCPEFERRLDDPYDKQFKSKKIRRSLEETPLRKKSKRKHSEGDNDTTNDPLDLQLGITATGNGTYEIWAHEDCIVWSPGIYLVGPKIVGLEEAVWTSCNVGCKLCGLRGANICCLKRGCGNTVHLCCGRQNDWQFDDFHFTARCRQHHIVP